MAEKVYFSLEAYFYFKKRPLLLKKAAYFFPHPVKDDKSEPERDLLQWHVKYLAEVILKSCVMGLPMQKLIWFANVKCLICSLPIILRK